MQVPHLVCTGEQVPSDLALPGGGVHEIGGSAESGDFCEQAVDGGLQRDLQRGQLAAGGEGPGALQRQDGGVGGVESDDSRGEVAACLVSGGLEGCEQRLRRVQAAVSQCQRASKAVCWTYCSRAFAILVSTSSGVVRRATAAVR